MPGDDFGPRAEFMDQRSEAKSQRLDTHQIDLAAEQPARVIFAEAGGLDHRLGFIRVRVRLQQGLWLGKH